MISLYPSKLHLFFIGFCLFALQTQAQLNINFSADVTEICAPGIVQFTNQTSSTAPIIQWEWKRDGYTFSNLQHPSLFFNQAGSYDICLIATDNLGNIDSLCLNNYIIAYQSPTANFSANATSGCTPLVVNFSDLSLLGDAPIQAWRWDFGDGFIDTINASPTHTYNTVGTFDVTLIVTDTNGCSHSILQSNLITVSNAVTAAITHNAYQVQCGLPASVSFHGVSSGPNLSYTWYFDDNTTGTGSSVTHNYLSSGCYAPTLAVSNGICAATATVASCISISDAPTADFTIADSTSCRIPFTASLLNQSTGITSFAWDFGDGNQSNTYHPTHTYTSYTLEDSTRYLKGVFPVVLTVSNAAGCVDQDTQHIYISNIQTFISNQNLPCAPDSAFYRAISENVSPAFSSINWSWALDHSMWSNGASASAYYSDSGIYNAQVIVTDNIGCSDTAFKRIEIGITPTIDTVITDTNYVCRLTAIDFQGYGSSYIDFWNWTFNDNSTGFGDAISHHFQDTGTITGSVTASFRGCIDTFELDSYYIFPPIAKFTHSIVCDSLTIHFIDESIGAHRWSWDFGDSTTLSDTSTLQNPSYTYSSPGDYIVTLIAYNDSTNCIDTFRSILIMAIPIADFSIPDSICTITTIIPTNNSQDAGAYQWTAFGSLPFTNNSANPQLTFSQPGIFPITLTAFSANGCFDTLRQYIHVAGIDTHIVHSPIPACRPATVIFTDSSTGILSPIVAWQWGNSSTLSTTNQQYAFPRQEIMPLQVTNDWGCTFDLADTINVGGLFINFSSARDICIGNSMTAVAITNSPANAGSFKPYTYIWDFGDGHLDTTSNPVTHYTYSQVGVYDLCLHIIDSIGCITSLCRPDWVEVHDPTALFTADTFYSSCPPLEVNFSNLSQSGSQWAWSFGDGSVSSLEHPTHVYSTSGFYDVILEVVAFSGCSHIDTIRQMIQITGPSGNFVMSPIDTCAPFTAEFTGSGTNIATYTWLFGNGDIQVNTTHNNNDTTYYTYHQAGVYVPILVIDDGMGCQISIEQDTIITHSPPSPAFIADSLICQFDSIHYQALSPLSNTTSVEWIFEGGFPASSTQINPTVYYPDTGSFDVQLIAWENGCSDTLLRTNFIAIKPLPIAQFGINRIDSCIPSLVHFSDSSTSPQGYIQSWDWNFGNHQSSNSQDSSVWYHQADSFGIQLIVENNFGCIDTVIAPLQTYPSPSANAGSYPVLCVGDTLQLQGTGNGNFHWASPAWISDSTIANPVSVLDSSQYYILTVYNNFGCRASDTVQVIASPLIWVDAGDSAHICAGDSIVLQATGNTTAYNWGVNNSLNCQYCPSPTAFPDSTSIYYLQANVSSNCVNKDSVIITVHPLPNAQIIADSSICEGDTLHLLALGGQHYAWLAGENLSDTTIPNPTAIPTSTSIYTVAIVDSNTCKDSFSIVVTTRSTDFVPIPDQTICLGDTATLTLSSGNNPSWQGDSLSCNTCPLAYAYPTDSSAYLVSYYNTNNCLVRDSLQIQVLDLTQLQALASDTICKGDSLQLQVLGHQNAPVLWSPNYALSSLSSPSPFVYPSVDTQYTVQIHQGQCHATDSISIAIHPPTLINTNDIDYCLGDSAQLLAIGNANHYVWTPTSHLNNDTIYNPIVTATTNQQYQVIGTGICNTDTAYARVQIHPFPNLQLDRSTNAMLGSTITLNSHANPNHNFTWFPSVDLSCVNCPNPSWLVQGNQTFYVTVTNAFGCPVSDSIHVHVFSDCTPDLVFVPNAFSPNQDGHNDILYAQSGTVQEIQTFQIYSRWGQLVFETNDLQRGWDGRFQGKALTADVFGYFIVFRCPNTGEEMLKKGNITILR
ncbi:PKD domain-containing protein [Aureispira anguillae]|uniref:PKD domain-containing protein n=1 Tax=Aureispira anguillae TaxID=2864201 RepID=A0A916DVT9_9BACT|nr:PKD domain-containing protein [Aureispira anguillae]BDS14736.1 PKD domain-containing protein [Aureispira anguillae]